MAGVLDSKSRLLDTIVTQEGRRQIASGDLRIRFVTFTDTDTFYRKDVTSGSEDPSLRLFFEAGNRPQDSITFEADDSGRLVPFRGALSEVIDGKIFSGSNFQIVTGSQFVSAAEELLDSSVENFDKLRIIRNEDVFFDKDNDFQLSLNRIDFNISDRSPFVPGQLSQINVDKAESLFQDRKLSSAPNFAYLPPINSTVNKDGSNTLLGSYPLLGESGKELSFEQIEKSLEGRESFTITFDRTSATNNIIGQFFENRQESLKKLDIIDFGEIETRDSNFPTKHIFFVGKIYFDSFGTQTFINMFTIIME